MNKKSIVLIAIAVIGMSTPVMIRAQPAPIHNPVVSRAPCGTAVAGGARARDTYMARPFKTRYDADAGGRHVGANRNTAGILVPALSISDVRRGIVVELNGKCD